MRLRVVGARKVDTRHVHETGLEQRRRAGAVGRDPRDAYVGMTTRHAIGKRSQQRRAAGHQYVIGRAHVVEQFDADLCAGFRGAAKPAVTAAADTSQRMRNQSSVDAGDDDSRVFGRCCRHCSRDATRGQREQVFDPAAQHLGETQRNDRRGCLAPRFDGAERLA